MGQRFLLCHFHMCLLLFRVPFNIDEVLMTIPPFDGTEVEL